MKKYLILIAVIPVVMYLMFQLPVNLEANTIIVPDDYPTIQGAIDASNNGDTVIVEPGRYIEGINFRGKEITVASRFYTEQDTSFISRTIIDGNKEVPSVVVYDTIQSRRAKLIGFTITGGYANNEVPETGEDVGGGIKAVSIGVLPSPHLTISDCIVRDNHARRLGGGIFADCALTLKNTRFFNNTTDGRGGGVFILASGSYLDPDKWEIVNCKIYSNSAYDRGGGMFIFGSAIKEIKITNCSIYDNIAVNGGGIYFVVSHYLEATTTTSMEATSIFNNKADKGGGISIYSGMPENLFFITNCTIMDNLANLTGGGIHLQEGGKGVVINSIIYKNLPQDITFSPEGAPSNLAIAYSNIKGGKEGVELNDNGELEWLEGNIDADPLFVDAENNDYRLGENSPCIDAGTSNFSYSGNVIVDMDESDYYGTAPDMGAYEWWGVSTGQNELPLPSGNRIELYPNPFNPATTIKFSLQKAGDVILSIYNVRGQRVLNLVEAFLDTGEHYYAWNGKDGEDNPVSSGVYLVKLEQGSDVAVTKTALMK